MTQWLIDKSKQNLSGNHTNLFGRIPQKVKQKMDEEDAFIYSNAQRKIGYFASKHSFQVKKMFETV